ncbi:5'-3' exonuclease [Priestia koreensis]|uniref:5'-3' exonuclease n=1 Tax=Priestia koreensis TaxID=284581 RepID=UPI001F565903|nr:5'-3' exonuclease H3TH domain-containing protein [Priestia koreensis]MCM3006448.1 flap endonuclease [Priestia koreensis]UNL83651.1 flap endonuclease [Priestia koreensis]
MNKLLLIDGFNLLSRCYFATSYGRDEEQLRRNSEGLCISALPVVFRKLLDLIHTYRPTHLLVAWDVKREDTSRKQLFDGYKDTRNELPSPLIEQYEALTHIFREIGVSQLALPPYEADDLLGALATKWSREQNSDCFIYSNDKDLFQLIDENVSQIIAVPKRGDKVYTKADFEAEYGISPTQWVDVKSLLGDRSDNIPGVPGVGEKAALPLIQEYKTLEGIYEDVDKLDTRFNRYKKKLTEGKEFAFLSRELAQIIVDIPEITERSFETLSFELNPIAWNEQLKKVELNIIIP